MNFSVTLTEMALKEMPLPTEWDASVFDVEASGLPPREAYRRMVAYARERATYVDEGASRTVFEVPYKGRPTVLKIAKNKSGFVQNKGDVAVFGNPQVIALRITIPMIDADPNGSWVHLEYADPLMTEQVPRWFGGAEYVIDAVRWCQRELGFSDSDILRLTGLSTYPASMKMGAADHVTQETPTLRALKQLLTLLPMEQTMAGLDWVTASNWGTWDGRPVIIDAGYSKEASDTPLKDWS